MKLSEIRPLSSPPDPGELYWRGFLPAVRARLGSRAHARPLSVPAAAAAAILLALSGGAALVWIPGEPGPRGVPAASIELVPEIGPAEILDAIDDLDRPAGLTGLWEQDGLLDHLNALDDGEARLLREELSGEPG